jgi:hypothetical protein
MTLEIRDVTLAVQPTRGVKQAFYQTSRQRVQNGVQRWYICIKKWQRTTLWLWEKPDRQLVGNYCITVSGFCRLSAWMATTKLPPKDAHRLCPWTFISIEYTTQSLKQNSILATLVKWYVSHQPSVWWNCCDEVLYLVVADDEKQDIFMVPSPCREYSLM